MLHTNLSVNEEGHLTFAGMDTVLLAKKYGTPLYLLDENRVRENCRRYISAMNRYFPAGSTPLYASKALSFRRMYEIVESEGMCVDVVSSGELYTALKAKFPAERIYFHGNNKTCSEIRMGVEAGIGYFIVDNADELDALNEIAGSMGKKQDILLRLTPGIDTHTYEAVNTGKVDSKFGTPIETGQAGEIVEHALSLENVNLRGYHCHVGSQVFDSSSFCDASAIMLSFAAEMEKKYGFTAGIINLGGGFGVRYVEGEPDVDYDENIKTIASHIEKNCESLGIAFPKILLEPGRSIVADAGLTLYTVGSVKTIKGYKSYAAIDGGMGDNPRFALYGSKYTAVLANRASEEPDFMCDIVGKCCESGDVIKKKALLPHPERGDIVAILVTGAYNYSMASNYNRIARPPIVAVKDGKDYVAVRRETFEDMTACDM